MRFAFFSILFIFLKVEAYALINVPIAVLESSYLPVYSNSERNTLIFSMPIALQAYGKKANLCGYDYSFLFSEFAYGKPESAMLATQYVLKNHPWAIWGPETNDELEQTRPFFNKESPVQFSPFTFESEYTDKNIVSLSTNENDEIDMLFKSVPNNRNLSDLALIYDPSCKMCALYFKTFVKKHPNIKIYHLNNPNEINTIKDKILKSGSKNIMLLLYGDTSGRFMEKFNESKGILFLGTKIFGNEASSELMNYNLKNIEILSVRPLPPVDFDAIHFNILDGDKTHRVFDNTYYMLYFADKMTSLLCKTKPKTESEFKKILIENREQFKYKPKFALMKFHNNKLYIDKIVQK